MLRDINFFEYYKSNSEEEVKVYYSLLSALMMLIVVSTLSINTTKIIILNNNIEKYENLLSNKDIKEKVKISEEINRKLNALTKYNKDLDVITNQVEDKDIVNNELLSAISAVTPKDIEFKVMNISSKGINIQAISKSRIAISEFQHNLKSLEEIEDAHISNIEEVGTIKGEFSFSIECYLKRGE